MKPWGYRWKSAPMRPRTLFLETTIMDSSLFKSINNDGLGLQLQRLMPPSLHKCGQGFGPWDFLVKFNSAYPGSPQLYFDCHDSNENIYYYFDLWFWHILMFVYSSIHAKVIFGLAVPSQHSCQRLAHLVSLETWVEHCAGVMGINKAGDLQYVFMPVIVPKALGNNAVVVLGNSTDINSEPALVYLDMSDLGLTSVIETFTKIPNDIRPEEHLPSKFIRGTIWETVKVPLGLACIPIIVPIFFWYACCRSFRLRLQFWQQACIAISKTFAIGVANQGEHQSARNQQQELR